MRITFDANKRRQVLEERGLDFNDAADAFDRFHVTGPDTREYEENRFISVAELKDGLVAKIIWTPRPGSRRIITMWKCSNGESEKYKRHRDESG